MRCEKCGKEKPDNAYFYLEFTSMEGIPYILCKECYKWFDFMEKVDLFLYKIREITGGSKND